ncbi:replication factor A protein 1-like isoform X3 [Phragmites australis]|uniref:replication factor A protein 1-like isoform X3 n=1 Tax=Phragmites australis TaxID=29695 RepID=UPI002D790EFD|nr:replication factor A protein 1-like isoform X3 [Phragmites australis]
MSTFMMKDINPRGRHWVICTRVSRMWDYRGGTDDGQIRHVDLVLLDAEGTPMYAEIGPNNIESKKPLFAEGKVYTLKRFRVIKSKPVYRPVESEFMIEITCHTLIKEKHDFPTDFPIYAYNLTKFADLPMLVGENKCFIDVIGIITEISELTTIQLQNQTRATSRRTIILRDQSNYEMKLFLWGQRASEFDADEVCALSQDGPVIVIFVGMLMKSYRGEYSLSGNTACRWYINSEVTEVDDFFDSLGGDFQPIKRVTPDEHQYIPRPVNVEPQQKTLHELFEISPYDFPTEGFCCIITISRIDPFISWWFPSCNRCSRTALPDGNDYKCSHCGCTGSTFKYKICVIGTNGTDEAEFVFFGAVGQRLIHKDVKLLMRSCHKANDIPSEITSLVSQKYLLTINVTSKCFDKAQRSYQVNAINCAYGRQPTIPIVKKLAARFAGGKRKATSLEGTSSTEASLQESHQNIKNTPASKDTPALTLSKTKDCSSNQSKVHARKEKLSRRQFKNEDPNQQKDDDSLDHELEDDMSNAAAGLLAGGCLPSVVNITSY